MISGVAYALRMRNAFIVSLIATVATLAACSDDASLSTNQSEEALRHRRHGKPMPTVDAGTIGAVDSGTPATKDAGAGTPTTDAGGTTTAAKCAPAPGSSTVVDVTTTGAKGDGSTDDTAAIQRAVTQAASAKGTVLVPDGTYMIDALKSISVPGNVTLKLSANATLKAIPNSSQDYAVLQISGANVNIIGGTIEGERSQHTGSGGEWGMGLNILGASHLVVEGVTAKELWGDGFYVSNSSTDVTFCGVSGLHNRRQGLSVISVNGMVVKDSTFNDTDGTAPQAGIDIEPNSGDSVQNVQILNSTANGNTGAGMFIYGSASGARVTNVTYDGNTLMNNKESGFDFYSASNITLTNNRISGNAGYAIRIEDGVSNVTGSGNNTSGSSNGIYDTSGNNNNIQ